MSQIKLDIPDLKINLEDSPDIRVILRQPNLIVNQGNLPFFDITEAAISASYAQNADTASFVLLQNVDGFSDYSQSISQLFDDVQQQISGSNTGSFSGSFFGTASYADNVGLLDNTGSATFATTGSNTFFGTQTIFDDVIIDSSNLIVTGSINLQGNMNVSEGIIVLDPIDAPTAVTGGILYSSSGEFFVGMNS
jgi:hypothetical protein